MNKFNKILCFVIIFSLLTTQVMAFYNNDEIDIEYSTDILLLEDIGVLDKSDIEKSSDSLVSRAELALTAVRLLNMSGFAEMYNGNQYFYDVSPEYTEASAIYVCVTLGLMKPVSDGYFSPLTPVTGHEVATVLTKVLGYGGLKDDPDVVNRITAELLNGVISGKDSPLTRRDFYTIIENSLEKDVLSVASYGADDVEWSTANGGTILEKYFGFNSDYGVVTANEETALKPGKLSVKGTIEIDNQRFVYNDGEAARDLLGRRVKYCWRETDDGYEAVNLIPIDEDVITIEAEDIKSYSGMKYTYWNEREKLKTADISGAYIIYNHHSTNGEVNFKPDCGKVVLINNDNDAGYDVVKILDYEHIYVSAVNTAKNCIYGQWGEVIRLDDLDSYTIITADGKKTLDVSLITEGAVISVLTDDNDKNTEIVVSNDVLSGKVDAISYESSHRISVNGSFYNISKALEEKISAGTEILPTTGIAYKMYLNSFGEIVFIEKVDDLYTNYEFGYALAGKVTNSLDDELCLKIFTMYGNAMEYTAADNLKIDEVKQDSPQEAFVKMCKNGENGHPTGAFVPQLIRFKLNTAGEISHIDLASDTPDGNDALYIKYDAITNGAIRYSTGARGFIELDTYRTLLGVTQTTPTLAVDASGASGVNSGTEANVITAQTAFTNTDYDDFIAYATDADSLKCDFIVRYAAASDKVDRLSNYCVYLGSGQIMENDETLTYIIYSADGTEAKVNVDPEIDITKLDVYDLDGLKVGTHKLEKGDVFRFSKNIKGYASVFEVDYSLSQNKLIAPGKATDTDYGRCTDNSSSSQYVYLFNTVYEIDPDKEYARLIFDEPENFDLSTSPYFDCYLDTMFTGNGRALAYSKSDETVRRLTKEDVLDWKTYGNEASVGLMTIRSLTPLTLIIYEE